MQSYALWTVYSYIMSAYGSTVRRQKLKSRDAFQCVDWVDLSTWPNVKVIESPQIRPDLVDYTAY